MTSDFSSRLVLVIDDDPFQLKMLSHLLTVLGFSKANIQTCLSGSEALASIREMEQEALLVVLDLNMPEMDGVEVVRQLAEQQFQGALALVSGEDARILETAANLARARQLNVLGHLDKPVQRETLEALMGRWCIQADTASRKARRLFTPEDVRNAITRHELLNYYQPKVDVATGAFQGVETLVRWMHPEEGLVFPDQFISIAEEHGLIDELTRVVLSGALRDGKRWRDEGMPLRVAVNVSMDNLTKLDFADYVLSEVLSSGFPPTELILEVTESRLMKDTLAPLDILTRLRLKHISLSIDDFGTGHSSLAQLRDMPFDELKIDRGFVHGAAQIPTVRAIFEGSLEIARQLGMKVVAEGVEDLADWLFLRQHHCNLAQGYFIAKPMPAMALSAWARDWDVRRAEIALS